MIGTLWLSSLEDQSPFGAWKATGASLAHYQCLLELPLTLVHGVLEANGVDSKYRGGSFRLLNKDSFQLCSSKIPTLQNIGSK